MSDTYYQPEAGQMCFGQPWQRYEGSDLLDAAVERIARTWECVMWNRLQRTIERPFNNSGTIFDTEGLSIHAYSWDEAAEQRWNLKCGDVEISWYKHSWRGLSVNRPMTNDDIDAFLQSALAALRPCDSGIGFERDQRWKRFTLNGDIHDETGLPTPIDRLEGEE